MVQTQQTIESDPPQPMTQIDGFDPYARSSMGQFFSNPTQVGRVRVRPKFELTRPVNSPTDHPSWPYTDPKKKKISWPYTDKKKKDLGKEIGNKVSERPKLPQHTLQTLSLAKSIWWPPKLYSVATLI